MSGAWSYPEAIPAAGLFADALPSGLTAQPSNGFTFDTFIRTIQSAGATAADLARTGASLSMLKDQFALEQLKARSAVAITSEQTKAARDIAIAEAQRQAAIARGETGSIADRIALKWSGYEWIMLAIAGAGLWFAMRGKR